MTSAPRRVLRFDDGGWLELVGNHLALDLVNTVSWRLEPDRTVDRLGDGAALVRWAAFAGAAPGLLPAGPAADAAATEVRALREELHGLLQPALEGRPAEAPVAQAQALLDRFGRALAVAGPEPGLPLRWSVEVRRAADLPHVLALSAVDLVRLPELDRLRLCRDGGCGWVFLDRTRNRSRLWCSSADCGNRHRARRHYAKVRSGAG